MADVYVVYSDIFATKHKPWRPHPENPGRLRRALRAITRYGLKSVVKWVKPVQAEKTLLYEVHAKGYVEYVFDLVKKAPAEIDPDTYVAQDTLDPALHVFGSAAHYCIRALSDKGIYVILGRPPGHHVGKGGRAFDAPTQGFCIFNNVAAAATAALKEGYESVVVIDFDVHHGNGTQEIYYRDNRVLFISLHQDPSSFYPYSSGFIDEVGEGRGRGYNVNIPLPPMCADDCYLRALDYVFNLVDRISPDIVLVSAGFDGYQGDGVAELFLSSITYYKIGVALRALQKPIVAVLEGGYSSGLEYGLPAFIAGLSGLRNPVGGKPTRSLPMVLRQVDNVLSKVDSLMRRFHGLS